MVNITKVQAGDNTIHTGQFNASDRRIEKSSF
jgi:hypothetical protein